MMPMHETGAGMAIEIRELARPAAEEKRAVWPALLRGIAGRCPRCGQGRMFRGYIKVEPTCGTCSLDLAAFRSDDAPPYFTILIVGHIVLPMILAMEHWVELPMGLLIGGWVTFTLALTLGLLPRVKGAVIAVQWATRSAG
jgi:uncharacterized protein (DUF983 family)